MPQPYAAKTAIHAAGLLLFLGVLVLVPSLQWLSPNTEDHENRRLAKFPGFPGTLAELGEFPAGFSAYMDDNFGLRGTLLRWYNLLLLELGASPSLRVVVGREGWLFYNNFEITNQNRGAMPLSPGELDLYVERFRSRREAVERRGLHYVLLPVPEKNSVYPEFLPESLRRAGPSRFAQLLAQLEKRGEPVVQTLPPLLAAKSGQARLYFQTDSHWTCRGAFVAYQALMDHIEPLNLPGVQRVRESELVIREKDDRPGMDLARNILHLEDVFREHRDARCRYRTRRDLVAVRVDDGFEAKNPYRTFRQHQHWRYSLRGAEPRTRLLLYRDSYGNALIPFLLHSFDEVIVVPRPNMQFDMSLIDRYRPDIVVYEFVERSLYWAPTKIAPGARSGNGEDDADI